MKKLDNLNFKIYDPIKLGEDNLEDYKLRYYMHHYNIHQNHNKIIEESCIDYLNTFLWNCYYYFKECKSWTWFYKFNNAPFISDVRKYIKNYDINSYKFKLDKPLKPLELLLCVIPPQYAYLLPKNYKYLAIDENSPIIYLFPRDYYLDMLYKNKYWECLPIIPNVDYSIINYTKNIILDNIEKNRNRCEL